MCNRSETQTKGLAACGFTITAVSSCSHLLVHRVSGTLIVAKRKKWLNVDNKSDETKVVPISEINCFNEDPFVVRQEQGPLEGSVK